MKRALLVDLDGTLVDTWPDLRDAACAVLERHGLAAADADVAAARRVCGQGAAAIMRALAAPAAAVEGLVPEMVEWYRGRATARSRPFAGTERWLERRVAVVTNKPRDLARPIVAHFFGGADLPVVAPEDAGAAKPDPRPVFAGLRALGVAPDRAVFVGDDLRDYQAAFAAAVPFVFAGYGYTAPGPGEWGGLPQPPAIAHAEELLELIDAWTDPHRP